MRAQTIPWRSNYLWGAVYIYDGLWARDQEGSGHTGIYANKDQLCEEVCDIFPGLRKDFYHNYHEGRRYDLPDVLARKARNSRPADRLGKNALGTRYLDRPDWGSTCSLVQNAYLTKRTITREELLEAQEREQLLAVAGFAGVYICTNSMHLNEIWFGKASDLADRPLHHRSYGFRLVRAYPTANEQTATALENHIHDCLELEDGVDRPTDRGKGMYIFRKPSVDGVAVIDNLLQTHYRHFFRQTAKFNKMLYTGLDEEE